MYRYAPLPTLVLLAMTALPQLAHATATVQDYGDGTCVRSDQALGAPQGTWNATTSTCTLDGGLSEPVVLSQPGLTLDCAGSTITGPGATTSTHGIEVSVDATVRNCSVSGFGVAINGTYTSGVQLLDNTLTDNDYGIVVWHGSNLRFEGNTATGNRTAGIYALVTSGAATPTVVVQSNTLADNGGANNYGHGLFLLASDAWVEGNVTSNNACVGMRVSGSYNTILNNTMTGEGWRRGEPLGSGTYSCSVGWGALDLGTNPAGDTVTGNTISEAFGAGIGVIGASGMLITNNTVTDGHHDGIYLHGTGNTLQDNRVEDNARWGLNLANVADNLISNNRFVNADNLLMRFTNPFTTVGQNDWNTARTAGTNIVAGEFFGGNFWGAPDGTGYSDTCADSDSDGICDTPYVIPVLCCVGGALADNTDSYPLALPNDPPTAVAGPDQNIPAGDVALLDGTNSFDDSTVSEDLAYAWTLLSTPLGSNAALTGTDTSSPSLATDLPGTFEVELIVTDTGGRSSPPDTVLISSLNLAPTAAISATGGAYVGDMLTLDGTSSADPELDPLTWIWQLTDQPLGSTIGLSTPDSSLASLTPDVAGNYTVTLTVDDGFHPSIPTNHDIMVATTEDYVEAIAVDTIAVIEDLAPTEVTTSGNQNALTNYLQQAAQLAQNGDTLGALAKLQQAKARADGCPERGTPDLQQNPYVKDWILDCPAQLTVFELLQDALEALE